MELRGFEPLTSCMPYRPGPSPGGAGRGPAWALPATIVAGRSPVRPDAWRRWLPTWLPGFNPLAALTSDERATQPVVDHEVPIATRARASADFMHCGPGAGEDR